VTPPAATSTARRAQSPRRARRAQATRAVATRVAPRIPRRVSGPARGRSAVRARPRPRRAAPQPLRLRLVAFAATLPDRGIVDRLVRGRAWIAVVGTLLIGLVAMQVSLLKLNAGIGSDVERAAALERTNGELRAQVSQLESGERIQENAAGLGMIMPPAGQISYLRAGGPAAAGAAQALHDQRFNDVSKVQPLPGEGDPSATDPVAANGPSTTGSNSTDSTSTTSSTDSSSSSGASSTDSTSTTSSSDSSSGTATTSTDSSGGGSSSGSSGSGSSSDSTGSGQ
jgi:hypothetical protein